MSKLSPWLLVIALLVTACGDAGSGGDGTVGAAGPTVASVSDDDAPEAPDFELALAGGDTFRLSAESRPVYLVFWAEW